MKKILITFLVACATMTLVAEQSGGRWNAPVPKSYADWKKSRGKIGKVTVKVKDPSLTSRAKQAVNTRVDREIKSVKNIQWTNKKRNDT